MGERVGPEDVTFRAEVWTHLCCRETLALHASPHFQSYYILKGNMCKDIDTGMTIGWDQSETQGTPKKLSQRASKPTPDLREWRYTGMSPSSSTLLALC